MPRPKSNVKGKAGPPVKSAAATSSSTPDETSKSNGTESAATTSSSTSAMGAGHSSSTDPQFLPPNEAKLLAQVFQQYEEKNYTASVETADLVLKKYPSNAQASCMKGLGVYNLGKREEGKGLARKGLALDVKSHVCWHVLAIIHRAEREYTEAMKCYTQAHRIEPNDMNVMRDLINVQLFSRQFAGAAKTRLQLLKQQPRIRHNWTAVAIALHLAGNYPKALEMLRAYMEMLEQIPPHDFEYSELILYRAQVYEEAGQADKALELLEKESRRIVDIQTRKEMIARLTKKLGKTKAAELKYVELLEDNADSKHYVTSYLSCRAIDLQHLDDTSRQNALDALSDLSDRLPKSRTIRRTVLDIAEGPFFRKRLTAYLMDGLSRGIPSLFSDVKHLLDRPAKKQLVLDTIGGFKAALENGKTLDGDELDDEEEAPTTYIWLLYLHAQTQLHLRQYQQALQSIDMAIEHSPTLPELYMTKARILKRSGDLLAAEYAMSQARSLDGQDRYLNAKSVKYLLKIDQVEEAEQIAGLFTRKDAESPLIDLTDMQCLWFLLAEAQSYHRAGKIALALKRCHTIEKIFAEIFEDEFDFHAYCVRKFTLRACVNMIRSNDVLRRHPIFIQAARLATDIYIELSTHPYDRPQTNGLHDIVKVNGKPEGEGKQYQAAEDEDEDKPSSLPDDDPYGEKLASTQTPLDQLDIFAKHLEATGQTSPKAQEILFDAFFAREQYGKAAKALATLQSIQPDCPASHWREAALRQRLASADKKQFATSVFAVLSDETGPSGASNEARNSAYLQRHPDDSDALVAAGKAAWWSAPQRSSEEVFSLFRQAARPELNPAVTTLQDALQFADKQMVASRVDLDGLRESFAVALPQATIFKSEAEREAQMKAILSLRKTEQEAGNEESSAESL